jgi:hypothetical protein
MFTRIEKQLLLSTISYSLAAALLSIQVATGNNVWGIPAAVFIGVGMGLLIYALCFFYKQREIRIIVNDVIP